MASSRHLDGCIASLAPAARGSGRRSPSSRRREGEAAAREAMTMDTQLLPTDVVGSRWFPVGLRRLLQSSSHGMWLVGSSSKRPRVYMSRAQMQRRGRRPPLQTISVVTPAHHVERKSESACCAPVPCPPHIHTHKLPSIDPVLYDTLNTFRLPYIYHVSKRPTQESLARD